MKNQQARQNAIKSRDIFEEVGNEQGMERVKGFDTMRVTTGESGKYFQMFSLFKKKFQLSPQKINMLPKEMTISNSKGLSFRPMIFEGANWLLVFGGVVKKRNPLT